MSLAAFGALPAGERLERIRQSPNWRDEQFQNPELTVQLAPGTSMPKLLTKFFFKPGDTRPPSPLPHVKTDLSRLPDEQQPVIVWFGHSSYLLAYRGQRILVDPVLSGYASPFPSFGHAFKGSDGYDANDFQDIDLLVLTHDHYDHLDYTTMMQLRSKVKKVITFLGVGAHLERWGYDPALLHELDWWDEVSAIGAWRITAAPGRHFSGRSLKRNRSLWGSFILQLNGFRLFLGGDSGYGAHFGEIGARSGPFDLALLETGQYNTGWPFIHMLPDHWLRACEDLGARALLPVHWGKFSLALHPWNEPPQLLSKYFAGQSTRLVIPKIGEPVLLGRYQPLEHWWEDF